MVSSTGSAPGRLDLLGGVADYSGALVLEMPTRVKTTVVAEPNDELVVGPVTLPVDVLKQLATAPYAEIRAALAEFPKWTHYVIGVALVLIRHEVIDPPRAALVVSSDVPQSVGVSSSAALEVASARALCTNGIEPLRLAALCQEAKVPLKILPSVREIVGGRVTVRDIRDVQIEDLLGRQQVETDLDAVRAIIQGRRVLVTGGGGSIGSERF